LIKSGGKQYKVKAGDDILLEKIEGKSGDLVELNDVIFLIDDKKNMAAHKDLSKVHVKGVIVEQTKGDKVIVYKHKAKKGYRRKRGHRQLLTKVKIEEIKFGEKKSTIAAESKKVEKKTAVKKETQGVSKKKEVKGKKETKETKETKKVVAKTAKKSVAKSTAKKPAKKSSAGKAKTEVTSKSAKKSKPADKPKSK